MIKSIIRYAQSTLERKKFLKNNPGVYTGRGLSLRCPQFIECGFKVNLGSNCKLLCWDTYQDNNFDHKPLIRIGSNFSATRNLTIQCANKILIGNNVLVASDVFIIDYNHGLSPLTDNYLDNPLKISKGVTIEDGAWIGNNVLIMPGVEIGFKSIIGAGSVVTKTIPPYSIAAGNPAKVIKIYDIDKSKWIKVG